MISGFDCYLWETLPASGHALCAVVRDTVGWPTGSWIVIGFERWLFCEPSGVHRETRVYPVVLTPWGIQTRPDMTEIIPA